MWFSTELCCSEGAASSSWDPLCIAVESDFILRDHPTPFTAAVATGPAKVEYKQNRISTAHVAAPPPCVCGVQAILVVLKPDSILTNFGGDGWNRSTCKGRFEWRPPCADRDRGSNRPPHDQKLAASLLHY